MRVNQSNATNLDIKNNEPAATGFIVPTPKVIQPGLFIIDIPTVAEGIELAQRGCHGASLTDRLAPRIILILYRSSAVAVKNGNKCCTKDI